jgi:hypothetical protein
MESVTPSDSAYRAPEAQVKRRPGRKKGSPPTRGSFGQPGAPDPAAAVAASRGVRTANRQTIEALCREHTPEVVARLAEIVRNGRESNAVRAGGVLLAYGHGTPVNRVQVDMQVRPRPAHELTDDEIRAFLSGGSREAPVLLEHQGGRHVYDQEGRLLEFSGYEPEGAVLP